MRNFMPYRGDIPPLSFAGIHTACISGNNGSGKSAIIDAITWALWGKTRAKSDDDLIHLGETEMEVEFDFTVGGLNYRIIRKHSRPRRQKASGQSSLDLFIATDGDFKPISGDRMGQTQQKIIDLLHMDYDTFINSAFLRQGHADEFTKQPPAKRKEVLANILGLSVYDRLEERAKELARRLQTEKAQLESTVLEIEQELAQKPQLEVELAGAQQELTRLERVLKEHQSRLERLRQEKQSLENKKLQLAQLEEHITATGKELGRRGEEINQHNSRIKEYRTLITQRQDIEAGYGRFSQVKRLNEELNRKLATLVRLNERKSRLEKSVQEAQSRLLAEHAVAQSRLSQLELSSQKLSQLRNEQAKLQEKRHQLAGLEEELEERRQQNQQLQTAVHEMEFAKERLQQEIKELEEKLELLRSQSDMVCPLCETEIGQEGMKHISDKYGVERTTKAESLRERESELAGKKQELEAAQTALRQLETTLGQERASLQGKTSLLAQAVADAEEAKGKLDEERQALAEIEGRLAGKEFATREQEALNEVEKELAVLGYDSEQHRQTGQQFKELEKYEPQKRKLEEAERLLGQEEEAQAKAEESAQELGCRLEADRQKKRILASELEALPRLDSDLAQAEAEHQALTVKQRGVQEITGSLKGKLEHLLKREQKKQEIESRLTQVSQEDKVYRDLAQAFGKKGIQAMLIETAIPEIEIEADRLLGRMTDNRMHVKIEALKPTKKGELVETLDIRISDELGTRNYELFSGGEAFRIDFALRIALSRLLARRAGAPLPTLIVDEGFGTQDSAGLEKLKEAINSIQCDFEKVIVITHIEELKDAFPVRINVVKTAQGSTIEVS